MFFRRRRRHDPQLVVVVAVGRSGSTLVQGLLNALPRTLVRGENGFFLKSLFDSAQTAVGFAARHGRHHPGRTSSAFYGVRALTRERFVAHTWALSLDVLCGDVDRRTIDRIGFKEVRWHEIEDAQVEPFFDWFDLTFPDARFVLNTRDPEAAAGSGFWRRHERDDALARMARVLAIQDHLEQRWPERTHRVAYEDLCDPDPIRRDETLVGLATFVAGECTGETLEALHRTMEIGHGPGSRGAVGQDTLD